MDWVEAIGYQKEALHTGALRHLLKGAQGVGVARALAENAQIAAVANPRLEVRVRSGSRRAVDLAADLALDDETEGRLAVEIKVDSAWTPDQLRETVGPDCHGVVVAVGYTALAIAEKDLSTIESVQPWRRVGPGHLAQIVRDHAGRDRELLHYADHLDREADDHARAVEAVRTCERVAWGRVPEVLDHWAYFSEVLCNRENVGEEWERKALISGPLMTQWLPAEGDRGPYLEFMGEGHRRSLCVKAWADTSDALRAHRNDLIGRLSGLDSTTPRAPGGRAKTCTAKRFGLEGMAPRRASELVDTLLTRLDAGRST